MVNDGNHLRGPPKSDREQEDGRGGYVTGGGGGGGTCVCVVRRSIDQATLLTNDTRSVSAAENGMSSYIQAMIWDPVMGRRGYSPD